VYDIYLRNTVILLTTKLQLFNQIELSNRSIPATTRQEWTDTLGRLIALLKARSNSAILIPSNIALSTIDARKTMVLPTMNIQADYLVDADLASALSILLIEGHGLAPSPMSCNLSLFLVDDADQQTRSIVDKLKLDKAQETRWRQLVSVVAQRVADSCGWTDQRDASSPSDQDKRR
jgi:hypothetical protein